MSARKNGRNGVSGRVAGEMAGRLRNIRALWLAVHNDPTRSVADMAAEFYFAVGELLEGKALRSVYLKQIDRARVSAHAEE